MLDVEMIICTSIDSKTIIRYVEKKPRNIYNVLNSSFSGYSENGMALKMKVYCT